MSKELIDKMVDRFLGWKLPTDFSPDCGVSFKPLDHPMSWPVGTNLFTAEQARQMFEHVLANEIMAIEVQGHVEKMEQGMNSMVRLTFYIEGARTSERIVLDATVEELSGQYLPGTTVTVTVRPGPKS